ncbi:MAG: hypothetical protein Q8908_09080 [Bacteroidota bacterium]|nr:hypothetical protein [Bacteroidota bacterium]
MFDNMPNGQTPDPSPVKRTATLTVVCILTFIFSGLSFISSLFYALYYNYLPQLIKSSPFTSAISGIEGMSDALKVMTQASIWFFIFNTLLYAMSLTGAILMFRLRKIGFHFYTMAQILLLILPLIYLQGYRTDFSNTAITAIFIFIYASNLRIMR